MNIIDFLIGLTLMNAMPHFVLGVWKGRMLSAFGFGDTKNMLYGVLNFAVSLGLFVSRYGTAQLFRNGIYAGAEDSTNQLAAKTVITRFSEILFLQAVRTYLSTVVTKREAGSMRCRTPKSASLLP